MIQSTDHKFQNKKYFEINKSKNRMTTYDPYENIPESEGCDNWIGHWDSRYKPGLTQEIQDIWSLWP